MTRRTLTATAALCAAALALSGCSQNDSEPKQGPATQTPADPRGTEGPPNSGEEDDLANFKPALSWEDAQKQAQEDFDGDFRAIQIALAEGGEIRYDIEMASDEQTYTAAYDAKTGDVISTDKEKHEGKGEVLSLDDYVGLDEAKSSALDVLPGRLTKIRLDAGSDGTAAYTIDVSPEQDGETFEVVVDAESGKAHRSDD